MSGRRTNAPRAGGDLVARERLERHGAGALADEELLAILVGKNGAHTAGALLEACGTVQQPAHESAGDLARVKGMTPARAAMIVAGVELGRRTLTRPRPDRQRLAAPREVAELLLPSYGASPVERFGIVSLSAKHRVLRHRDRVDRDAGREPRPSPGGLPDGRDTPRRRHRALQQPPASDATPSVDDVALTERLQQAGTLMGIEVVDHVILADTRYCSFKEMGRL